MNKQWQRVPIHWQEDVRFEHVNVQYLAFRSHASRLTHRSGERREQEKPLKPPRVLMFQTVMSPFVNGIQSHSESSVPVLNRFRRCNRTTAWEENHMPKLSKSDDSTMKALILYQDFAFAVKANEVLQHSAEYSEFRVQWNIRPWRVDLLKFPPAAEEAQADAADAHLIVFGSRCALSFPFWLEDWLEQWAKCRQIEDAALALIHEDSGDSLSIPPTPGLSHFANHYGLNIIFDASIAIITSSIRPPQNFGFRDDHQGWGINE
jgi:hypothetical protein